MERRANSHRFPAQSEPVSLPATVLDGNRAVIVEKNEQDELTITVANGEQPLCCVKVTPDNQVHVIFQANSVPSPCGQQPEQDTPVQVSSALSRKESVPSPEQAKKPVCLQGKITAAGTLTKTAKQQRPVYRFQIQDERQKTTHRIVAFDEIAAGLSEIDNFTPEQPIKLLAWKHENRVHINGQMRTLEEWYAQKIWYHNTILEKPKKQPQK